MFFFCGSSPLWVHNSALPQRMLVVSLFPFVFQFVVSIARVCFFWFFFGVMLCNRCVKWIINAWVCEGWLHILNTCVVSVRWEMQDSLFFFVSGTHKCQTSSSGLTNVDRCMLLELQLAEGLRSWHGEITYSSQHCCTRRPPSHLLHSLPQRSCVDAQ